MANQAQLIIVNPPPVAGNVNEDDNGEHEEEDDIDSTAAVVTGIGLDDQLLRAAKAGDWTLMEEALQNGANENVKSKTVKLTALHIVIRDRHWTIAFRLLEVAGEEIDLEATDDSSRGDTPFFYACYSGTFAMVQKLFSLGANMQHVNKREKQHFITLAH